MFYRCWIQPTSLKITECYSDNNWSRLDKLINPVDGDQQKQDLDKSLVEWTQDDLVKLCPFCAKSFTIARRRHHCRLCGAVLCNSCSAFLEYKDACKLVRPAKLYTDPYDIIEERLRAKEDEEKPKIRVCEDCSRLLQKRIQSIEDYYCQPEFLELYGKLRGTMLEADNLMIAFNNLVSERRKPSQEMKDRILELKQAVASISAKLAKMSNRATGKQAYLFSAITQSVSHWLRETSEEKNMRIQGSRGQRPNTSGWVPEPASSSMEVNEEDDPLLIQIKNLEEYIRQARLADRYEEVSTLEESKRDLEMEYIEQKRLECLGDGGGGGDGDGGDKRDEEERAR